MIKFWQKRFLDFITNSYSFSRRNYLFQILSIISISPPPIEIEFAPGPNFMAMLTIAIPRLRASAEFLR